MSQIHKQKLLEPVEVEGIGLVEELNFQTRVRAKHMKGITIKAEANTWDEMMTIAGRLCGQPDLVMNELLFPDVQAIMVVVSGFLFGSLPTGTTSSPSSPDSSASE